MEIQRCIRKQSPIVDLYPVGARGCYNKGKRCAGTLFTEYQRKYSLNVKLVRILNTYGPGMDVSDERVVSNFIIQALRGSDLTICGSGAQTRSFCYVDDIVKGLMLMMDSQEGFSGPVNIGTPQELQIGRLLKLSKRFVNQIHESYISRYHKMIPSDAVLMSPLPVKS